MMMLVWNKARDIQRRMDRMIWSGRIRESRDSRGMKKRLIVGDII
jgi:hypothetical protein